MSATPKSVDDKLGMQEQRETTMLGGANSAWLENQYEQYLRDPNSVDEQWRDYFAGLPMVAENARETAHSEIREQFRQLSKSPMARAGAAAAAGAAVGAGAMAVVGGSASSDELKQIYVNQLINAYRVRGHQLAKTDPLGVESTAMVRELRLLENGLSDADLDTVIAVLSDTNSCISITHLKKTGYSSVSRVSHRHQCSMRIPKNGFCSVLRRRRVWSAISVRAMSVKSAFH